MDLRGIAWLPGIVISGMSMRARCRHTPSGVRFVYVLCIDISIRIHRSDDKPHYALGRRALRVGQAISAAQAAINRVERHFRFL